MPRFIRTLRSPIRGINVSIPEDELTDEQRFVPESLNWLPRDGFWKKRLGYTELLEGIPGAGAVMGGFEYGDAAGDIHFVVVTADTLAEYDSGGPSSWIDITGTAFTGGSSNHFSFGTVGGAGATNLYLTNGVDAIREWTGSGDSSDLAISSFTTLIVRTLIGYKGHLVAGDTVEDGTVFPYRLRWSRVADPGNFAIGSNSTAGFVDLIEDEENSKIQTLVPLREVLVTYKEGAIYNVVAEGNGIFLPDPKVMDRGAISRKAVAPVVDGNRHLVVAEDNIFVFDGFSFQQPPVGDRIKKEFFGNLNYEQREKIFVKSFPNRFECWILTPEGASTEPNRAYCWNWLYDSWTKHEFADNANSLIYSNRFFSDQKALLGTNGNEVMELFLGNTDNETAINSNWRPALKDFQDQNSAEPFGQMLKQAVRQIEIDSDGTPQFQAGAVDNILDSITYETAKSFADRDNIHIGDSEQLSAGRYVTARIIDDSTDTPPQISELRIEIETRGER